MVDLLLNCSCMDLIHANRTSNSLALGTSAVTLCFKLNFYGHCKFTALEFFPQLTLQPHLSSGVSSYQRSGPPAQPASDPTATFLPPQPSLLGHGLLLFLPVGSPPDTLNLA